MLNLLTTRWPHSDPFEAALLRQSGEEIGQQSHGAGDNVMSESAERVKGAESVEIEAAHLTSQRINIHTKMPV
ncbi:MAG TPA: hypothetical protein VFS24_12075, partial [Steroidobacteraceae bacterium]|nr:hypothetical protein [Steroidobacteraceae bacterium]